MFGKNWKIVNGFFVCRRCGRCPEREVGRYMNQDEVADAIVQHSKSKLCRFGFNRVKGANTLFDLVVHFSETNTGKRFVNAIDFLDEKVFDKILNNGL